MGIGFSELVIIAVVALIFIGPQKLPTFLQDLARFCVQAKRMSNEVKSSFDQVVEEAENAIKQEKAIAMAPQEKIVPQEKLTAVIPALDIDTHFL